MNLDKQRIKWKKNDSCSLCSNERSVFQLRSENYFSVDEFEVNSLSEEFKIIDIREVSEISDTAIFTAYKYHNIPLSTIDSTPSVITKEHKYLIVCSKGIRSYKLVKKLREQKYDNCFSLINGLEGL